MLASNPAEDLFTIRDLLRFAISRFEAEDIYYGHGTDNVWDEAVALIMRALKLPLTDNTVFLDARLTYAEREHLLDLIEKRTMARIPAAYLNHEAWFMGLPFYVDERVLVPRSPIGELLEKGLEPWIGELEPQRILDLCTGSGCIGIAAAFIFEESQVDLADISPEALEVAAINIQKHGVGDCVRAIQSDLFSNLSGRYDLILCNPPYVDAADFASMPREFMHEPALGLTAGHDGLDIVKRILAQAGDYLTDDGLLVLEVGNSCVALEAAYSRHAFTWAEFDRGGHGVLIMNATELRGLIATIGH